MNRILAAIAAGIVIAIVFVPPVSAANSNFECRGDSVAIANACAARWEAANVRAHAAMGSYGTSSRACLVSYAAFLERSAAGWVASGKLPDTSAATPCNRPDVARLDDGLLSKLCPGKVWRYSNRGSPGCDIEHLYRTPPSTLTENERRILVRAATGSEPGPAARLALHVTEYQIPTPDSQTTAITVGPDHALWFTEYHVNKIGRIDNAGRVTEYSIPSANSGPWGIASGSDGALWFTESIGGGGGKIGRITTEGVISEYLMAPVPLSVAGTPLNYVRSRIPMTIVAGPDGALWFTESANNVIGRITTGGTVSEYNIPTPNSHPLGIANGPDGALWFTETGGKIGRITTDGSVIEYTVSTPKSSPTAIVLGPGGALWFTDWGSNTLGRIVAHGAMLAHKIPTANGKARAIVAGPDGAMWFTEFGTNSIGRISSTGDIVEYSVPGHDTWPFGIVVGADRALWFTEAKGNKIARFTVESIRK
jgi:virginiamycin B lyase